MMYSEIAERIAKRTATVGVIGLGYVGLPLGLAFAEKGFRVVGFDVDAHKIELLSRGDSYIQHVAPARVSAALAEQRFHATADFDLLASCDAIIICVPTPLTAAREPDLSFVVRTAQRITRCLRAGQLIVLESTTYPGTTDEVLKPMLQSTGLRAGEDFYLAFSPEREDPGNLAYTTTSIAKVVGGCDARSGDLAAQLYGQVIERVVRVSNAACAEATKITENVFRAVNIALVNELKVVFERMGIDVWEVLDAAATKPFGFMRFNPGPGWGGHCIPLDPFYLAWKARECGTDTKFIELAGEVNRAMPTYVVDRIQQALNASCKAVRGSTVLLIGMAYKKDVADTRESPAFPIAQRLIGLGARLQYHDPLVPELPTTRSWPEHPVMRSTPLEPQALRSVDVVVVVTDHTQIDYALIREHARLIVDCRGVYRDLCERIVRA